MAPVPAWLLPRFPWLGGFSSSCRRCLDPLGSRSSSWECWKPARSIPVLPALLGSTGRRSSGITGAGSLGGWKTQFRPGEKTTGKAAKDRNGKLSSNPSRLQGLSREFPAQIPALPAVGTPSIIQERSWLLREWLQGLGWRSPHPVPGQLPGLGAAAPTFHGTVVAVEIWECRRGSNREWGRLPHSQAFPMSLFQTASKISPEERKPHYWWENSPKWEGIPSSRHGSSGMFSCSGKHNSSGKSREETALKEIPAGLCPGNDG